MVSPTAAELLSRNASTLSTFQPRPHFSELRAAGAPRLSTIIISCADPRICPEEFFGLKPGDALVFRTGGGDPATVLQTIAVLDAWQGGDAFQQLFIVHHTDCGRSHVDVDYSREFYIEKHPERKEEVENWKLDAYSGRSVEQAVADDAKKVRENVYITDTLKKGTKGFVFDVKTGEVKEVPV